MSKGPTAIILAAGASTRMGTHKALLYWSGEPIIAAHARALYARCSSVVAVLGAQHGAIRAVLPDFVEVRYNTDWATDEMRDSLKFGLNGLSGTVLFTPVDCPPTPVHLLDLLIEAGGDTVLSHQGQDGHPVRFEAEQMRDALTTQTLSEALRGATRVDVQWSGCIASWNTPLEWAARVP
jgi:molybdenum cofactor cytidylyltransferase